MHIIHYLLISTALLLPVAYGMDREQENQNYVNQNAELSQLKKERSARRQEELRQLSQDTYNTRSNTDNPFVRLVQEAGNSSQPQQQEDTITLSEEPQPGEGIAGNQNDNSAVLPNDMLIEIINKLGQNEQLKLRSLNKFWNDKILSDGTIHILRFSDKHFEKLKEKANEKLGSRSREELFSDSDSDSDSYFEMLKRQAREEELGHPSSIEVMTADIWSQIFTTFGTIDTLDLRDLQSVNDKNYLISLAILPQITNLNLGRASSRHRFRTTLLSPEDISTVAHHFPKLMQLTVLGCRDFTYQELASLSNLTGLTHLTLTDLYGSGILALANLTNLTDLTLALSSIRVNWIEALSPLTNLRRLNLWDSSNMITAENLPDLVHTFPNLTYLGLGACDLITDVGLQHLAELKNLKELDVSGNMEITEDGLNSLRMQLPNLKIINDNDKKPSEIVEKEVQRKDIELVF